MEREQGTRPLLTHGVKRPDNTPTLPPPSLQGDACLAGAAAAGAPVDAAARAALAGRGPRVLAGPRVRMGVNVGVPEGVFVHDVTHAVAYRGAEFDLAGDVADMAAGGQVLLAPKAYQGYVRAIGGGSGGGGGGRGGVGGGGGGTGGGGSGVVAAAAAAAARARAAPIDSLLNRLVRRRQQALVTADAGSAAAVEAPVRSADSSATDAGASASAGARASATLSAVWAQLGGRPSGSTGPGSSAVARTLSAASDAHVGGGASGRPSVAASDVSTQSSLSSSAAALAAAARSTAQPRPRTSSAKATGAVSYAVHGPTGRATIAAAAPPPRLSGAAVPARQPSGEPAAAALLAAAASGVAAAEAPAVLHAACPQCPGRPPMHGAAGAAAGGARCLSRLARQGPPPAADSTAGSSGPLGEGVVDGRAEAVPTQQQSGWAAPPSPDASDSGLAMAPPAAQPRRFSAPLAPAPDAPDPFAWHDHRDGDGGAQAADNGGGGGAGAAAAAAPCLDAAYAGLVARHSAVAAAATPTVTATSATSALAPAALGLAPAVERAPAAGAAVDPAPAPGGGGRGIAAFAAASGALRAAGRFLWHALALPGSGDSSGDGGVDGAAAGSGWADDGEQLPAGAHAGALLVDVGAYAWRDDGGDGGGGGGGDGAPADDEEGDAGGGGGEAAAAAAPALLHLWQALPAALASRLMLLPWPLPASVGDVRPQDLCPPLSSKRCRPSFPALPFGSTKYAPLLPTRPPSHAQDPLLRQTGPGFLDAPGAAAAWPSHARELWAAAGLRPLPPPTATIAFASPAGLGDVEAADAALARACRALFLRRARALLRAAGGYESKEVGAGGALMAAFARPAAALQWALALQLALLEAPWPEGLARFEAAATVVESAPSVVGGTTGSSGKGESGKSGVLLFRGLRARVGVCSGPIDRIAPGGGGRADFLGPPANRAARLMAAARGGQVLLEAGEAAAVMREWAAAAAAAAPAAAATEEPSRLSASTKAPDPQQQQQQQVLSTPGHGDGAAAAASAAPPQLLVEVAPAAYSPSDASTGAAQALRRQRSSAATDAHQHGPVRGLHRQLSLAASERPRRSGASTARHNSAGGGGSSSSGYAATNINSGGGSSGAVLRRSWAGSGGGAAAADDRLSSRGVLDAVAAAVRAHSMPPSGADAPQGPPCEQQQGAAAAALATVPHRRLGRRPVPLVIACGSADGSASGAAAPSPPRPPHHAFGPAVAAAVDAGGAYHGVPPSPSQVATLQGLRARRHARAAAAAGRGEGTASSPPWRLPSPLTPAASLAAEPLRSHASLDSKGSPHDAPPAAAASAAVLRSSAAGAAGAAARRSGAGSSSGSSSGSGARAHSGVAAAATTVAAQCFRITPVAAAQRDHSAGGGGGGGGSGGPASGGSGSGSGSGGGNDAPPQATVTYLRYSAAGQRAPPRVTSDEGGARAPLDAATGAPQHAPRPPVEPASCCSDAAAAVVVAVSFRRCGDFELKGVAALVRVAQVLPAALLGRLALTAPPPSKGKARCVAPAEGPLEAGCESVVTAWLPTLPPQTAAEQQQQHHHPL